MVQEFNIDGVNYRIENGLTNLSFSPNTVIQLETAQTTIAKVREILGDTHNLLYVDLKNLKSVSREARVFYATEDAVYNFKAIALLAESPVAKIIGNFVIKLNMPQRPTRLFSSKEEAMAWLEQFKE